MYIQWYGQSCFRLQGDKSTVIIDPLDTNSGLKLPRLAGDIVVCTNPELDGTSVKGTGAAEPFVITAPGEYEVKETFVYGIALGAETKKSPHMLLRIEADGLTIAHLGSMPPQSLNGYGSKLEGVDILIIPVGGGSTLNGKQATEFISQLEPRVVIPMYYKIPGLKIACDPLDKFCKEIGICPKDTLEKYKIVKKDLPQQDVQIVVLRP